MTGLFIVASMFMLLLPHHPLKMALILTFTSSICALLSYQLTNSVFLSSSVIISFSSGMMILFCYCSIMSNYEGKNSPQQTAFPFILAALIMILYSTTPNTSSSLIQKITSLTFSFPLIIFIMLVVIIAMKGINSSFFNPTKKLLKSY